jgi:hypothetical protein
MRVTFVLNCKCRKDYMKDWSVNFLQFFHHFQALLCRYHIEVFMKHVYIYIHIYHQSQITDYTVHNQQQR